jgi:hypothetical protein
MIIKSVGMGFLTTERETPPFMALTMKKSYILKGFHSRYFTIGGRGYREIRSTNTVLVCVSRGNHPKQEFLLSDVCTIGDGRKMMMKR